MAYKKFVKFTKRKFPLKKKSTFKRRTKYPLTMHNSNPSQLIAPRYITKLIYADKESVPSSLAGVSNCILFNLNSIYDPNRTHGGHQPLGRDQLALLYGRYRVFGATWRVEFAPSGSVSGCATCFVIPVNNANALAGSVPNEILEHPLVKFKDNSIEKSTVFTGYISLAKLAGQTVQQFKSGLEYQALMTSDPTELMTLQVGCIPTYGAAGPFIFNITITYHVECFDPIPLPSS